MHVYLYVVCKTAECNVHHVLKHVEWPTADYGSLEVADREFPLHLKCRRCGQVHSYHGLEVRTDTSPLPLHPSDFQGVLPDEPPPDTN